MEAKFQLDNIDLSSDSWMTLCLLQSKLLLHRQLLKESLEVADAGVKLFKKSVEMWQVKLEALITSESHEMSKGFEQAFEYLKPQVCELGLLHFVLFGTFSDYSQSVFGVDLSEKSWPQSALMVMVESGSQVEE